MSYNAAGTYVQVTGATNAQPGLTVFSSTWNNIHTDIGGALTQYMQQFITQSGNRNLLWMNGGFEVWQRTTGNAPGFTLLANNTTQVADRWYLTSGINQAMTVTGVTGLVNTSRFACRVRKTAGETGTQTIIFAYTLDVDEINAMKGKFVTLTFLIKAGANYSGAISAILFTGTGGGGPAKRNFTPYTGEVLAINSTPTLTPGGSTVTITATSSAQIATNITQAEVSFLYTPVGTAGAADDYTIDDVQLEVQNSAGTFVPTAFDRQAFSVMLRGCKRFYQKTLDYSVFPFSGGGRGSALAFISGAAARCGVYWRFPIEMRASPTIGLFNPDAGGINWVNITAASSIAPTVETSTQSTKGVFILSATVTAIDNECLIHSVADASI